MLILWCQRGERDIFIGCYRDEADHHYVPKRKLNDILIN